MESRLFSDIGRHTKGEAILLVGSSGNIGSRALELLLTHGKAAAITAFDKKEPRLTSLPPQVKVMHGADADITDPEATGRAIEGVSIVICAVGVPRFTPPGEKKLTPYELEQNGMQHIVDAAKKEGVKQIIYISALGVARGDATCSRAPQGGSVGGWQGSCAPGNETDRTTYRCLPEGVSTSTSSDGVLPMSARPIGESGVTTVAPGAGSAVAVPPTCGRPALPAPARIARGLPRRVIRSSTRSMRTTTA